MSARDRGRGPKKLKRKVEVRPEIVIFKVYAEGEATECEYLALLEHLPGLDSKIDVRMEVGMSGATPLTLVEAAVADKLSSPLEVDRHWCVFDVESPQRHPYLNDAAQKANAKDIGLAINNPCFELWLVLHHRFHGGYLTTDNAIELRHQLDGAVGKHLDAATYTARVPQAVKHAERLRKKHVGDGTSFPDDNPSSGMDLLIADLRAVVEQKGAQAISSAEPEATADQA